MPTAIQLIVGLGNPGANYEHTRHNAGAWFVSDLAKQTHASLRMESKFFGLHAVSNIGSDECHLLIPTTYMNLSGQAVKALSNFYKITPEQILIVHDEIDLPVGVARLKLGGGHGGHNGLRDIIEKLGTQQFYRIRVGVGRPEHSREVEDYVLRPPKKEERIEIDFALQRAEKVLPLIINGDMAKAMQELHTEKE